MNNFFPNKEAVVEMVKDMSSPGLLHSWRSSGVLDEKYVLLSQISTHVSGYLNMPSANCGSGLSKGLSNMLSSNRLSVFASEKAMTSHGSADKKNDEVDLTVPGDLAILAFIEVLQLDKRLLDPNTK
uniref:Uncharacterized protein n=1 Tax=Solanum lycopersicum TaxID=4081 RepID=A0A3Q7G1G9_SOLLC